MIENLLTYSMSQRSVLLTIQNGENVLFEKHAENWLPFILLRIHEVLRSKKVGSPSLGRWTSCLPSTKVHGNTGIFIQSKANCIYVKKNATLRSAPLYCVYPEEALVTDELIHTRTTRPAVVQADKNSTIRAIQSFIQSFICSFVAIPNWAASFQRSQMTLKIACLLRSVRPSLSLHHLIFCWAIHLFHRKAA